MEHPLSAPQATQASQASQAPHAPQGDTLASSTSFHVNKHEYVSFKKLPLKSSLNPIIAFQNIKSSFGENIEKVILMFHWFV